MNTLRATATLPMSSSLSGRFRRALLGISTGATRTERRGFRVAVPAVGERLERIGTTFAAGYHAALVDPRAEPLADRLHAEVPAGWRGFAFEGAGMGLALVDFLASLGPGRRPSRLAELLEGPGHRHRYLVAVGAGWTLARLPRRTAPLLASLEPQLRWLALDGYGFHHGYFGWRRAVVRQHRPGRLAGPGAAYVRRAFDQGLGRSLWFVEGADPQRIAGRIAAFPAARRGDLWSGVGLACAYAGGLEAEGVGRLRTLADGWAGDLAQGAAFAAKARIDGGEAVPHLDTACTVLCGRPGAAAAALTTRLERELDARPDEPLEVAVPLYEDWRRRVRDVLAAEETR
ncbi:MAG TPA: DUF1702 family protein [Thermoanaerobaculia bacterium]|nr:DUF1702 family protein [Thermoanaerobaculia bacterium]